MGQCFSETNIKVWEQKVSEPPQPSGFQSRPPTIQSDAKKFAHTINKVQNAKSRAVNFLSASDPPSGITLFLGLVAGGSAIKKHLPVECRSLPEKRSVSDLRETRSTSSSEIERTYQFLSVRETLTPLN
jgi:hypothetical protein